jgi:2-phospho-L-lactate guanylyltransferase
MTIWAIVPIKPLRRGKSRLAGTLTEEQRTRLNRYLLERTLTILNKIPSIEHTLVVSRDPAALALTRSMGGRTVLEDGEPQFNTALKRATIVAQSQGARAVLILPADLPLVTSDDIKAFLSLGKDPPVIVIAPDRRLDGTNCLFVNPAGLIDYCYGLGSYQKHKNCAIEGGGKVKIVNSDRFNLDLDLPEDLEMVGGLKGLNLE